MVNLRNQGPDEGRMRNQGGDERRTRNQGRGLRGG